LGFELVLDRILSFPKNTLIILDLLLFGTKLTNLNTNPKYLLKKKNTNPKHKQIKNQNITNPNHYKSKYIYIGKGG